GRDNPAASLPTAPEPVIQPPPNYPVPSAPPPQNLQVLAGEIAQTYRSITTLTADYENHQVNGKETYYAKAHMLFAKPRKLRIDIKDSSDSLLSGASIVWLGGSTLKGRKDIGFIPIKQEHKLTDKPSIRGWTLNQTDYDAMVRSLLAGLPGAKLLGQSRIGGQSLLMVEYRATLPGVTLERIGIDTNRRLPLYREFRESANGQIVFSTIYTRPVLNARFPANAFSL
ncbi:MAG: hypothetical protein HY692_00945, partial [Cyanobacteria bacterium NC_groundwater_1444_Ag_S-0.65um_54_12]|nr:hypothetical protein [Cyanobacteria bacterium NC_groundwater_1444_Ag_S-0.65um_54_12]